MSDPMPKLPPLPLPEGVRSRMITGINGLSMHVLEAGFETSGRDTVVLLHGFPELSYSWRKVMPALARAGYHVLAPDQRGYGRTTAIGVTREVTFDDELAPYRMLNLAGDIVSLVRAFNLDSVRAIVGHDFGASVAVWCAMARPDVFRSLVFMSAPFGGFPSLLRDTAKVGGVVPKLDPVHDDLAALSRPRKHYQWYYSTRPAAAEMRNPPQGLHAFLRAYYHHKSADWAGNQPFPLAAWSAQELAKMPTYYVMDLAETMPETVAHEMPGPEEVSTCAWLTETEMAVYASEFARTGFQPSLNWYRCRTSGQFAGEQCLFDRASIEVATAFIAGRQDWGVHQKAGEFERMQSGVFTNWRGCHLIDGAGHWVQQEQPEETNRLLLEFLESSGV